MPTDTEVLGEIRAENWHKGYPNLKYGVSQDWVNEKAQDGVSLRKNAARRKSIIDSRKPSANSFWRVARLVDTDQVIGFIEGRRDGDKQELHTLHVKEKYRNTGIGQALIDQFMQWVDLKKPIFVDVACYNNRAIKFYKRNGFQETNHTYSYEVLPMMRMRYAA